MRSLRGGKSIRLNVSRRWERRRSCGSATKQFVAIFSFEISWSLTRLSFSQDGLPAEICLALMLWAMATSWAVLRKSTFSKTNKAGVDGPFFVCRTSQELASEDRMYVKTVKHQQTPSVNLPRANVEDSSPNRLHADDAKEVTPSGIERPEANQIVANYPHARSKAFPSPSYFTLCELKFFSISAGECSLHISPGVSFSNRHVKFMLCLSTLKNMSYTHGKDQHFRLNYHYIFALTWTSVAHNTAFTPSFHPPISSWFGTI